MRFLIIASRFHTNLYYRVIALQEAGHETKVLVLYKGHSEYYKNINIEVLDLSFFSKILHQTIRLFKKNHLKTNLQLRLQSPNRKLKKEIKYFNPDVILLKAYQNMLAIKTLFFAKRYKIRVLMLTQTTFTHIKGSKCLFHLNIKLFKWLGVYAYITPIKSNYDAFKKAGIDNVYYFPFVFPVTDSLIYKKHKPENIKNEIKIISVGKFIKRKDHLLLIKACHRLLLENYRLVLNIFGEEADKEYLNEIENYIKNNKLENWIIIHTNVAYKELLDEYAKHDLFVLPAYAEPAAYSIVEALANGLPVICSDQNGTNCYIYDRENGYVFEAGNIKNLVEKLEILVSDCHLLEKMAEKSIFTANKVHNLEDFAKGIIKIVEN